AAPGHRAVALHPTRPRKQPPPGPIRDPRRGRRIRHPQTAPHTLPEHNPLRPRQTRPPALGHRNPHHPRKLQPPQETAGAGTPEILRDHECAAAWSAWMRPFLRAAVATRVWQRQSMEWMAAVLAAEPTAMPRSMSRRLQTGPVNSRTADWSRRVLVWWRNSAQVAYPQAPQS